MPIRTGTQFIEKLNAMKNVIWVDGKRVEGPLSQHPYFSGIIQSKAELYDLQAEPDRLEQMTYSSPLTGERVGLSFLTPVCREDLQRRRVMMSEWAKHTSGLMGRSPDYMNTAIMAFASAAELFGAKNRVYGERLRRFYEYCREQDLSTAHTFIRPPVDRHHVTSEGTDELPSLSVIRTNAEGMIVDGARLMATQGGVTDELLVFPSYIPEIFAEDRHPLSFAFAIPSNTKGITFLGRTPYHEGSRFDSPLGSRFDEIDMIVRFDHVLIPWERVFLYGDVALANRIYEESGFYPQAMHQVLCRMKVKLEFIAGLMATMAELLEIAAAPTVKEWLLEGYETAVILEGMLLSSEAAARPNRWGVWTPSAVPLYTGLRTYSRVYPKLLQSMQQLGASHLFSNASAADLQSEHGEWLRGVLGAPDGRSDGERKSHVFHAARELCASSFGARQSVYEQFFFGDPMRVMERFYEQCDLEACREHTDRFLNGSRD
ncbi:4-hydroxyphenylacetate 3-hydroxylase N-terminal domain-containing protein [Paenibacillus turpanensis]|uniref:4-hydroxyphenylacetate 3-hydroxylase N-terminal domain-containing protein n=1 Tax=Paenibacillus turpanensis TaxID=2689078 RepID=UPI001409BC42